MVTICEIYIVSDELPGRPSLRLCAPLESSLVNETTFNVINALFVHALFSCIASFSDVACSNLVCAPAQHSLREKQGPIGRPEQTAPCQAAISWPLAEPYGAEALAGRSGALRR